MLYNLKMRDNQAIKFLQEYSSQLNPVIESILKEKVKEAGEVGKVPSELVARLLEVSKGGKRIRGSLLKLAYLATGGKDTEDILMPSAAMEIFHSGLLVLDDVADRAPLRRGVQTVHEYFKDQKDLHYGESLGVMAGDYGCYLSWLVLMTSKFSSEALRKAGEVYADYALRLICGQVLDLSSETSAVTEAEILNVLRYKTAEYTGVLPMLIGYHLSECKDLQVYEALKTYGVGLGWAFQIQDDVMDLFGDPAVTKKEVGADIREGKNTLLMLYVDKFGTDVQKKVKKRVLGNQQASAQDIAELKQVVVDCGAYAEVKKLAMGYVTEGKQAITRITSDDYLKEILNGLIEYMVERIS